MLMLASHRSRALLLGGASLLALFNCQPSFAQRASSLGASTGARPVAGTPGAPRPGQALPNALQRANALRARAATAADVAAQAQRAARAAQTRTLTGPTLNGLGLGALDFGGRTRTRTGDATDERTWQGADLPGQATAADGSVTVTIRQDEAKAILNWDTFNVGSKTTLVFDQSAGNTATAPKGAQEWIAFNRVNDAAARPSEILGNIKAEGQVYVVNRGGIVFGAGSQVNVHTLAASSLRLTDKQFMQGINTEVLIRSGGNGNAIAAPTFGEHGPASVNYLSLARQPEPGFVYGAAPGDVVIEKGAQIDAARGGKVLAFAPHVRNGGRITAMDGQVILAAGEQVWVKASVPSQLGDQTIVRGLDVIVSAPARYAFAQTEYTAALTGTYYYEHEFARSLNDVILPEMEARAAAIDYRVVNSGIVLSEFGDITIQGRTIDQNGILEATTGLNNRNGTIRLQGVELGMYAAYTDYDPRLFGFRAGTVNLGAGSVTAVSPDLRDTGLLEGEAVKTRYASGKIDIRGKTIKLDTDSSLMTPAGDIIIRAAANPDQSLEPGGIGDGSSIDIGKNAFISVGGLQDMLAPMARNTVMAELRINELRDSPLYRDSFLRGRVVLVDRRASGTFEDGPMAGVKWLSEPGQWVGTPLADVSQWVGVGTTDLAELSTKGGSLLLNAGDGLITRSGSMLDVGGGSVRYLDGYVQTSRLIGADGGIYDIGNADPGRLYIGLAEGFQTIHSRWGVIDTWATALSGRGRFERGYTEGRAGGAIQMYAGGPIVLEGDTWGGVIVGDRQTTKPAQAGKWAFGDGTNSTRRFLFDTLVIGDKGVRLADDNSNIDEFFDPDAELFQRKTTYLSAKSLSESGMGTLDFYMVEGVDVQEGATVSLTPGGYLGFTANAGIDQYVVANIDGTLNVAGGIVEISGRFDELNLGATSRIDVGGDFVNQALDGIAARPLAINAGTIMLSADAIAAASGAILDVSGGGVVRQDGATYAFSGGNAGLIQIQGISGEALQGLDMRGHAAGAGGRIRVDTDVDVVAGTGMTAADGFLLPANLYAERGFASVEIGTTGDVKLGAGTALRQQIHSIDLRGRDLSALATGTDLSTIGALTVLPAQDRDALAPSYLALTGTHVVMDAGATIAADIGGTVRLEANENLMVGGSIDAPAGSILLYAKGEELALASTARLTARGVPVTYRDGFGNTTGYVLSGGTVSMSADGNLALQAGAVVDVSGASGTIQVPVGEGAKRTMRDVLLASDGGSITLNGGGLVASTFVAKAGGAGAFGGKLHFGVTSTAHTSPRDILLQTLQYSTPSCLNTGDCSPEHVAGADLRMLFDLYYGPTYLEDVYGFTGPLVVSQGLVSAFPSGLGGDLVLSATSNGGSAPIDLASHGLSPAAIQIFMNEFGLDLPGLVEQTASSKSLVVRPGAFANGGFADMALQAGGTITLDKLDLNFARRVSITGAVRSNGSNASITASHIVLDGQSDAAADLAGKLTLKGDLIDVGGTGGDTSLRGYATTVLEATDIRFNRTREQREVRFAADGTLVLRAGQVSPGTGAKATVTAGDMLLIERFGDAATPLAAAGSLTFEAPVIDHKGVIRAPFGAISFKAAESLTLGAGSITSVTGDGLVLPYGTLLNGEQWFEPDANANGLVELLGPPEKRVSFTAPAIDVQEGAVIDVRGGGDLYAWESVPGPGGSHDLLALPGLFAILPDKALSLAPDQIESAGQRIWLDGGNGIAAGWYTVLPSRFAALPGAFAVSLANGAFTGSRASTRLPDGSIVMNGHMGNALTGAEDVLPSTWRIYSGDVIRGYSEYNEALANGFFSSEAFRQTQYRLTGKTIVTRRLARDGGSVVFSATDSLNFDGLLRSQAATGGSGGLVDISAARIAVLADASVADPALEGYLRLDAKTLSGFGAGSLLLGGTRSGDLRGLRVDVTATDVLIANTSATALTGAEIILAARDNVIVAGGAEIRATGGFSGSSADLVLTKDGAGDHGALLRVSNGSQVRVLREVVDSAAGGLVSIAAGARVDGGKALLIDATDDTLVDGAQLSGEALSLASGRIGFGGTGDGLIIDDRTLAQLASTRDLTLRSYSTIDFFRDIDLSNFQSVSLDAPALVGRAGQSVSLSGKRILLENSGGAFAETGLASGGTLTLRGDEIVLGLGAKQIAGFATLDITASGRILAQGSGSLAAGNAAVNLVAGQITGSGGAEQSVRTTGALRIAGNGTAPDASIDSLGTRLSFTGGSVNVTGRINALGGAVDLTATGGDVALGDGALIDVGGFAKRFFDVDAFGDAGSIRLNATGNGSVLLGQGARLDLSSDARGGGAGLLSIATSAGSVSLAGTIDARAAVGEKGASFTLQVDELPDFAGLNQRLNEGGFSRSRQFRIRKGDVTIDGTTSVADFGVIADAGTITVAGTIDARQTYGGRIAISGGNGVTLTGGARLLAGATDATLGSGRVTIEASGGTLRLDGGTIDVGGGEGGRVRLRALRTGANSDVAVGSLATGIVGARSTVLEAVSVYTGNSVDAVRGQAVADANAFAGNAAAIAARLGRSDIAVMAGIEIRSTGDLTLSSDWNLGELAQHEGGLTLRAAGNLIVKGNLSDGFSSASRSGLLRDAASWDIRLVAGADLGSASALSVQAAEALAPNTGSVTIGDTAAGFVVRTGTGDLTVAAGRDLTLGHVNSAIYTAGRLDTRPLAGFEIGPQWRVGQGTFTDPGSGMYEGRPAEFARHGGHVTIAAQGDVVSQKQTSEGSYFSDWIARQGQVDSFGVFGPALFGLPFGNVYKQPQQTAWWVDYSRFQHGIGALGGGNLALDAGGDVVDLLAAVASNGRVTGGRSASEAKALVLGNGGLMDIEVAGAIKGGQYLAGRGQAEISAGTLATGRTITIQFENGNPALVLPLAPVVALGDAQMRIRTAGDLRLETVVDPLLSVIPATQNDRDVPYSYASEMYSFTDRTSLELVSTGGDVMLVNRGQHLIRDAVLRGNGEPLGAAANLSRVGFSANRYPMLLRIAALNGDVTNDGYLSTVTGIPLAGAAHQAQSELRILAAGDIELGAITQSRASYDALSTVFKPGYVSDFARERILRNENIDAAALMGGNPDLLPLSADFDVSRIYALDGSIGMGSQRNLMENIVGVRLNEATWLRAGQDIRNLQLYMRNIHKTDVSLIEAGNDIIAMYDTINGGGQEVEIIGPGALVLTAGRDIYGQALDIWSYGNQRYDANNRILPGTRIKGLPDQGAEITMIAGLNGSAPGYDAFVAAYLDPANLAAMPSYLKETGADGVVRPIYFTDRTETRVGVPDKVVRTGLVSFMKGITGQTLTPEEAWTQYQALPEATRQRFVRDVYVQELRSGGQDQLFPGEGGLPRNGGYNRGYAAIKVLFPGDAWAGELRFTDALVRTMGGGDIQMIAPGGGLQVAALNTVADAGRGLVTLGFGNIEVATKGDVVVNRSRLLTFAGGDEIVWSTLGDIDAGRGAKTTRVPTAPEIRYDGDGNVAVLERADISGSGIGTIRGFTAVEPGDVTLIAPEGSVNAGDAGIRVSGNLYIAALRVLNADNIDVEGEAFGVPTAPAVDVNLNLDTSSVAGAAAVAARAMQGSRQTRPTTITVTIDGFGLGIECDPRATDCER